MPHGTVIATNGQTLKVNASVSHWTTEALALTASGTNDVESTTTTTITSDYTMWFANTATTATITVKQLDGTTIATYTGLEVGPGVGTRRLAPVPDVYQLAADAALSREQALAPTGALAETVPRAGGTLVNSGYLVSGRLHLVAINLAKGTTVTSISFMSGTQAAVAPTAQWFALYDSAYALLRQTADDTSTAWGASTVKTLALTSTFTTTYSGLHYLGICVVAGTTPSLQCDLTLSTVLALPPFLNAVGDTGLTTTAPATATPGASATGQPYAYVK